MTKRHRSRLTSAAKRLRLAQTDAERLLWRHLQNRNLNGFKFRRQYVIDKYIVDFVCLERKTIVELDGGQHVDNRASDGARTKKLESSGYQVIRFWNDEVLQQINEVLEQILFELGKHPSP